MREVAEPRTKAETARLMAKTCTRKRQLTAKRMARRAHSWPEKAMSGLKERMSRAKRKATAMEPHRERAPPRSFPPTTTPRETGLASIRRRVPRSRSPQMASKPRTTAMKLRSSLTTVAKSISTNRFMRRLSALPRRVSSAATQCTWMPRRWPAPLSTPRLKIDSGSGGATTWGRTSA